MYFFFEPRVTFKTILPNNNNYSRVSSHVGYRYGFLWPSDTRSPIAQPPRLGVRSEHVFEFLVWDYRQSTVRSKRTRFRDAK